MTRNIVMSVSYDGSDYCGFQTQPNHHTIQDHLEKAIYLLTGERVKVHSSGRTDAGVHAKEQVINFWTESNIPLERWCFAINSRLSGNIAVFQAREAALDFHARKSAKRKTYRYSIWRCRIPDVFHRKTRFHHPAPLDVEAMREAISALEGEHDFTSFCSVRASVGSHVRTIYETSIEFMPQPIDGDGGAGVIHIYVTGNGFLYNMVRIIVGTLIEIGEGKRDSIELQKVLLAQDRGRAGPTAMAHGLMLWSVQY